VLELVRNPPVQFWPRIVIGAFATLYWWSQLRPTLSPKDGLMDRIINWFVCVTSAIGMSELLGLI
jgi:hypothetical protein